MAGRAFATLIYVISVVYGSRQSLRDDWQKTWILETDRLPTDNSSGQTTVDFRMMAAVGNGHVASVLYSPTVYMNGLFNGPVGWTHRAAIQTIHDVSIDVEGIHVTRAYALDMWRGVFTETMRADGLEVKVMTYAHQRLVQLLVTEIHVTRSDAGLGQIALRVKRSEMNSTVDLEIIPPERLTNLTGCETPYMYTRGHTHITETPTTDVSNVHIFWTPIPASLTLPRDRNSQQWLFFSSYDKERGKARYAFERGLNLRTFTPNVLRESHEKAWADRWNSGRIDVKGDDDLDTVIHSSLYYILMSLPVDHPELPLDQFYGLSPGSLARGANWTDYQGHVFWDMETWMYPPILALFPHLARDMLSYRIYGGEGARAKAIEHGYEGWQFPWESAYTGYEMTPLICVPCREYEQHITGDIAFAARQYWAMTRDARWLEMEGGLKLINNTAAFWASRAVYNRERDGYDINGVMPPDEYAQHVNNSVYTNFVAKVNMETARYLDCLMGQKAEETGRDHLLEVASKLYMAFNQSGQYHPEYEGYDNLDTAWNNDQKVKQADVVMLGYPLGMKMDPQIRRNDLTLYRERGDPGGPAMTWSMFAINWLALGETESAAMHFNNSYKWYTRKPFNVWTEVKTGLGASNFITGMGGFLQAVLFGYGGLRMELERVTFAPTLPPGVTELRMRGLQYLGAAFDVLVTDERIVFIVRELSEEEFPLQLRGLSSGTVWRLWEGREVVLRREDFELSTLTVTECPLPQGSSCPDVVRGDDSKEREPLMPSNIGRVHVEQTGGDRCGDFIHCSRLVQQFTEADDTVNFYVGDDRRVYQGSSIATQSGVLKIAMVGDYTLRGMTTEQNALLRRLIKCGMEKSNIDPDYKLQYGSEHAEDCGKAPCSGNSLHCQLKQWRHWDSATLEGIEPDCIQTPSPFSSLYPSSRPAFTPTPTPQDPRSQCPPVMTAQVTCNCESSRARDVSNVAAHGVVFLVFFDLLLLVVAIFVSECL